MLACAQGLTNKQVAAQEQVSQPTVGKWRSRFVEARCDGLVDEPRPGRPATITAEQVEDVVVATLESTPDNATHMVTRIDGRAVGLAQVDDRAHLEELRAATTPLRALQTLKRPPVRGEGLRRCRALPGPTRVRNGFVRG